MTERIPPPSNDAAELEELALLRDELGHALRNEVPTEGPHFWQQVDDRLNQVVNNPAVDHVDAREEADITVTTSSKAGDRGRAGIERQPRVAGWPLAIAAALLLIAGVFVGLRFLPSDGETVDAGLANQPGTVDVALLPGPTMNLDHWHAVYGVWDCTAEEGAGGWLAPFASNQDDSGIHSHGDGLIHIHPFFEYSQGPNARFGLFANEMGITVTDETLTLDDGRVLQEGELCNGQPAVLHLRRWTLDVQLQANPDTPPKVITTELNEERFYNDREVWTLAFAPLDADIPLPPQDRFETLVQHVPVFDESTLPDVIQPGITLTSPATGSQGVGPQSGPNIIPAIPMVPGDADNAIAVDGPMTSAFMANMLSRTPGLLDPTVDALVEVPEADMYNQVIPRPGGVEVENDLRSHLSEPDTKVALSTIERFAVSTSTGRALDLFRFSSSGDGTPQSLRQCSVVVQSLGGVPTSTESCVGGPAAVGLHRLVPGTTFDVGTQIVLRYPAVDGVWMVVELDDGLTVVANIAAGTSFASWPGNTAPVRVAVLDVDHNELWSDTP